MTAIPLAPICAAWRAWKEKRYQKQKHSAILFIQYCHLSATHCIAFIVKSIHSCNLRKKNKTDAYGHKDQRQDESNWRTSSYILENLPVSCFVKDWRALFQIKFFLFFHFLLRAQCSCVIIVTKALLCWDMLQIEEMKLWLTNSWESLRLMQPTCTITWSILQRQAPTCARLKQFSCYRNLNIWRNLDFAV